MPDHRTKEHCDLPLSIYEGYRAQVRSAPGRVNVSRMGPLMGSISLGPLTPDEADVLALSLVRAAADARSRTDLKKVA